MFSDAPVPRAVIEAAIAAAGTAPSGANHQPWHFAAISSPDIKHRVRLAAEAEEREFYASRAGQEWLEALAPLGDKGRMDLVMTVGQYTQVSMILNSFGIQVEEGWTVDPDLRA